MVYQLIVKKRFKNKLEKLLTYLESEFGLIVTKKFAQRLDHKFQTLLQYPFMGMQSPTILNIRSIRAGKHSRIYYRIEKDKIVVVNMYDTRINPRKNRYR